MNSDGQAGNGGNAASMQSPDIKVSIVIATYNRGATLRRLLDDIAAQTVAKDSYEVILVDDGSQPPAADAVGESTWPFALTLLRQDNAGAATARNSGMARANGDIVVIIDDDMQLPPDFLEQHLLAHAADADVVLGHIKAAPHLEKMPLFERFHAAQLARFVAGVEAGRVRVRGVHLCSGNMSVKKDLLDKTGLFDESLPRSEDRELGIRLEAEGARLRFASQAISVHHSDHASLDVWLGRAFKYGLADAMIADKHPQLEMADPWRFLTLVSPLSRPLLLAVVAMPGSARYAARGIMRLGDVIDSMGIERLALAATTLSYGFEYFRGMRTHAQSLPRAVGAFLNYRHKRRAANGQVQQDGRAATMKKFVTAIRADFASVQRNRAKYHGDTIPLWHMPMHMVKKIGLQMATAVRVMQLLKDSGIPLAPQIASRVIRHLYAAEIHWDAKIAPGISIVHGNGLVIGHGASIASGCILFHNVTLGEGIDPTTRAVGTPTLEENVHVGPGATLLGPITVGKGSKIMAGATLSCSVPPNSLVQAPAASVVPRAGGQQKEQSDRSVKA